MQPPNSIADLTANWPTIGAFADAIGCGYEAARQMRNRNAIAAKHWQRVISASQEHGISGVTYEWLAALHAPAQEPAE